LKENAIHIPEVENIPKSRRKLFLCLFVRRGICDVRTFITALQQSVLNEEQRIFEPRLSRACRIVENAFGIFWCWVWRISKTNFFTSCRKKARKIALASLNFYLMRKKSGAYVTRGLTHVENVETGEITADDRRMSWQLMTLQNSQSGETFF
jgi:hypothetical protein